jgi:hypothetical protein
MKKALGVGVLILGLSGFAFSGGFSIRATGGLSLLMGGDYNAYIDNLNSQYNLSPLFVSQRPERMTQGMTFGGEVLYHFSDAFGIGLGTGFISASSESTLLASLGIFTMTQTFNPQITAVPLTLNLHYFLPISSRLNFHAFLGPGLYFSNVTYGFTIKVPAELDSILDTFKPEGKAVLGFQGGLGLELRLNERVFLVVDAGGRMVRISGLTGQEEASGIIGGFPLHVVRTSTLWYYEENMAGITAIYLDIEQSQPSSPLVRNVREGAFSLGGFTFQAGLRIKL